MAEALLQRLRQKCDEKGVAGVKNLARLFRLMDADGSRNLSIGEFREGMEDYGVFLDEYELDTLFQALDSDRSGEIDVGEFIDRVRVRKKNAVFYWFFMVFWWFFGVFWWFFFDNFRIF
eukprot:TRINITY_DN12648_c0_g1_i4.p1 TRINITY_DN12648_c0_g1~~TRINITY_DN12648_c0_g1_i4.p1  ORF type:complete len:119 (+),score=17.61 TRINITY_DN12648_c0_g1_i4:49-405(+)